MNSSIERAYQITNAKSRSDLARMLDITAPAVQGYEKRGNLPLEQCIKIVEQTGVSLDWLILGKGEPRPQNEQTQLHPEQKMLLTGFNSLNGKQQDYVFALIRRLTRGESTEQAVQHITNIYGNVGQANAGNGNIENISL